MLERGQGVWGGRLWFHFKYHTSVWNRTTFFSTSSPLVVDGYLFVLYQYGGCLSPCMFCLVWMANTERTAHWCTGWRFLLCRISYPVFSSTLLCLFSLLVGTGMAWNFGCISNGLLAIWVATESFNWVGSRIVKILWKSSSKFTIKVPSFESNK